MKQAKLQLAVLPDGLLGIFAAKSADGWLPCGFEYALNPKRDATSECKVRRVKAKQRTRIDWLEPDKRGYGADRYRIRASGRTVKVDENAIDFAVNTHSRFQAHGRYVLESLPLSVDLANRMNELRKPGEPITDFYLRMLDAGIGEPVEVWATICKFFHDGDVLSGCHPEQANMGETGS